MSSRAYSGLLMLFGSGGILITRACNDLANRVTKPLAKLCGSMESLTRLDFEGAEVSEGIQTYGVYEMEEIVESYQKVRLWADRRRRKVL